jgi:hypothetical protein
MLGSFFDCQPVQKIFSPSKCRSRFKGPPSLQWTSGRGFFTQVLKQSEIAADNLHLVPMPRTRGAIPPLLHMSSWYFCDIILPSWALRVIRGSNLGRGKRFLCPPNRLNGICGLPSLQFSGYLASFPGIKRSGRDVDHSSPSSIDIKNGWSYTASTCGVDRGILCFDSVQMSPTGSWYSRTTSICLLLEVQLPLCNKSRETK